MFHSRSHVPTEVLLHNVVDKKFQNLFKPLYYLTVVFCLRKFRLQDDIVTPNTKRDIISCSLAMSMVYMLLFFTLGYFSVIFDTNTVYVLYSIAYCQYAFDYTVLCFFNVFESQINVDVLLNIYAINRRLENSKDDVKVRRVTWCLTGSLMGVYFCLVVTKLILDPLWNWSRATFIATTLIFDLELLYVVFVAYFLACKIETWRGHVKDKLDNSEENTSQEEVELNDVFAIYEMIVNAIELTNKASRWTIIFHFMVAFTQAIVYIEITILWLKTPTVDPVVASSHMFGVVLWVVKSLITETILCVAVEILYRRIEAAQVEVILLLGERPSDAMRRFKKNIFRISRTRLNKLNPWGIFYVDAALPLRMCAFIANYVIVLLQFAFV